MNLFRTIRLIRSMGILNFILFLLAFFGLMVFILLIALMPKATHIPTISEITDSKKETIPFETLTETQLQEGNIVEGIIRFNMGDFTKTVDEDQERYTHYPFLLGDKVMSIAVYDTKDNLALERQAGSYATHLSREGLSIWQYHEENNNSKKKKKKAKKDQKTVKQVIQENMEIEPGVDFRGKVTKMDTATEEALKNYVIPEGGSEPVFEILPYEIKTVRPVNLGGMIYAYLIITLFGIVGTAALVIFIWRMWHHKFSP